MLTQEQALKFFDYNSSTGELIWKYRPEKTNSWNSRFAGKVAGGVADPWRKFVKIDGVSFLVHRVVWLRAYGTLPKQLDHKDGNGYNNRLENLREATQSQNMWNRIAIKRGGVDRVCNKFRAKIMIRYKQVYLGLFSTREEAEQAYIEASKKLRGEFSAHNRGR
jgi:hypothetical protein